ncbi:MAG: prepilin peptidase [Armatimonadota bacterium]|nr:prepilin peptidase [Armatimonadota bacterium]
MLAPQTGFLMMNVLLAGALAVAVVSDLRTRRVPNAVVVPVALAGVLLAAATSGWRGAAESLGGMVVGMALLLPVWLAGGTGAGDVKLMGMVGALRGAEFALFTLLFGAIAGGVMALAALAWRGAAHEVLGNVAAYLQRAVLLGAPGRVEPTSKSFRMSYALALAVGAVGAAFYLG